LGQLKRLAIHLGVRLTDLSLKKEPEFIRLSFTLLGPEEREAQFHQSLADLKDIIEFKVE